MSTGISQAVENIEETSVFQPKFDTSGLISAIVVDARDNSVLMFAFMNDQALTACRQTGFVHLWSRSRQKLWKKGETSGETLKIVAIKTDCDQDALLIEALPQGRGATCHTGRRSCFYRTLDLETGSLQSHDDNRLFDPNEIYGS